MFETIATEFKFETLSNNTSKAEAEGAGKPMNPTLKTGITILAAALTFKAVDAAIDHFVGGDMPPAKR